jgi:hypothetical protein
MLAFLNIFVEPPEADPPPVSPNRRGGWEYEGTEIPAVGAKDLTLGEKLNPLRIGRPGQEPIAVLLPASEVDGNPGLEWARQAGTELEAAEGPLIRVPFPVWQEHAEELVGAWLPERDAKGIDRSLAVAEREFRFAQQALEGTRMVRNCLVVLATQLGRSRREVGESLGLSLGRVQQLNEDPSHAVLEVVEELLEAATLVAKNVGPHPCPREDVPKPRALSHQQLDQVIRAMLVVGLLEESADGLQLTSDGLALIGSTPPVARQDRKKAADRKGAANAGN